MNTVYRNGIIELIELQDFRYFTTLVFNRDITANGARHFLRELHARLDRKALGRNWARKDPHNERLLSISFIEHPLTNLHFHMLWRAPQHETMLIEAMPGIWKKLFKSGDVDTKPILKIDKLSWYCTKELTPDSYILSTEFSSQPSHHGIGRLSHAG
jgi:hypothetical protein